MPPSNPAAGMTATPARGLIEARADAHGRRNCAGGARLLSADSARSMRAGHVDVPATVDGSVQQGLGGG